MVQNILNATILTKSTKTEGISPKHTYISKEMYEIVVWGTTTIPP